MVETVRRDLVDGLYVWRGEGGWGGRGVDTREEVDTGEYFISGNMEKICSEFLFLFAKDPTCNRTKVDAGFNGLPVSD